MALEDIDERVEDRDVELEEVIGAEVLELELRVEESELVLMAEEVVGAELGLEELELVLDADELDSVELVLVLD